MHIKDTVFGQNLVVTLRQLGLFITVEVNVVPVRMLCHVEDPKRIQMKVVTVYHKTAARKKQLTAGGTVSSRTVFKFDYKFQVITN